MIAGPGPGQRPGPRRRRRRRSPTCSTTSTRCSRAAGADWRHVVKMNFYVPDLAMRAPDQRAVARALPRSRRPSRPPHPARRRPVRPCRATSSPTWTTDADLHSARDTLLARRRHRPRGVDLAARPAPRRGRRARPGSTTSCVDMQHGMTDSADVIAMLHAMARTPTVPIVRVPWNEPGHHRPGARRRRPRRDHPDGQLGRGGASGPSPRAATRPTGRGASARSARDVRYGDRLRRQRQRASWPASR